MKSQLRNSWLSTFQDEPFATDYDSSRFFPPIPPQFEQQGDSLPDILFQESPFVLGGSEDVVQSCIPMQAEEEDEEAMLLKLAPEEYLHAKYILDHLDEELEWDEFDREEVDSLSLSDEEDILPQCNRTQVPISEEIKEWFPYRNKQVIPKLGQENSLFKAHLPSKEYMKAFAEEMKGVGVGAHTHEYQGYWGNLVYVNDPNTMIAESIANPLIRKHLPFLPEDIGDVIQEL
ncbi:hypothetical protein BT69DRAFT_1291642 [Atractiella rhizophila]|nr:hypothetical protein BT69DRAFT_1291642 [Atractiella rhizophila]